MFNERGYRSGKIVGQLRYVDRTNDFIISSLTGIVGIDQWNVPMWRSLIWSYYPDKKIAFIINKNYVLDKKFDSPYVTDVLHLQDDLYLVLSDIYFYSIIKAKDPYKKLSEYFLR